MKRQMQRTAITAALALTMAGGTALAQVGPPTGGGTQPPTALCARVVLGPAKSLSADSLRTRSSFSAARTTDIIFHVLFEGMPGDEHVVTLKVYTPHGFLYRTLDVPIAPGKGNAPMGTRRLTGYPYPVKVQAPHDVTVDGNHYASVDVSFPVAGSSIVTNSLYGRWRVEVYMDGAKQPCPGATTFDIRQ